MSYKIDCEKLTEKLTIDDIKNVMISLGATLYKETDRECIYDTICHGGSKHKLYLWKELKIQLTCFTNCGNFTIFKLIQNIKRCSFPQSLEYVCEVCGIPYETTQRLTQRNDSTIDNWKSSLTKYIRYKNNESTLKTYDKSILNFFEDRYHESWLNEGLTIESMEKYQIKWYPYSNAIIIPVFDEEFNLVGIRQRNINPVDVERAKYIPTTLLDGTSYAFPTNYTLYGTTFNTQAVRRLKRVWLPESEKSIIKLDGWYGIDNCSLARYGSNLSKFNRDYILKQGVDEVVIIADRDFKEYDTEEYFKWEEKQFKLASMFKGFCKISIAYDKHLELEYKDNITDGDKETFERLLEEREEVF